MEDVLISFDTAVLAKEKGFNIKTSNIWAIVNKETRCRIINASELFDNEYYAPTQSLLQKWLREVHNFHINICNTNPGTKVDFRFSMEELGKSDSDESKKRIILGSKGSFKTYEEALEKGLQEALKLIK